MVRTWKVTAECNMDASDYRTVVVKANTERKAQIFAEQKLKQKGVFMITNLRLKEINESEIA